MKIFLNNRLYSMEAVKEAAEDFNEICECDIISDKIEIELVPKTDVSEPVDKEFCNYVLGLMKNRELI